MGQPCTIINSTNQGICVEWRVSPVNIILVASYEITTYATRSHTQNAYW